MNKKDFFFVCFLKMAHKSRVHCNVFVILFMSYNIFEVELFWVRVPRRKMKSLAEHKPNLIKIY